MSVVIMTAVWQDSEARGSARMVLLSLADQANDDGYCWPSVGSIAKRCRISERSVQDHLKTLVEDVQEVERHERPGRSTVYRVLVHLGGARSAPVRDLHPAESAPGGEAGRRGGVQDSAPRTVIEPSLNPHGATPPKKKAETGTRLDPSWRPSPELRKQMTDECPGLDLEFEHRRFVDHWIGAPGARGRKSDWDATWRNWMRKAWADLAPRTRQAPERTYREQPVPERPPWEKAAS